jgi:hypothetical protein
MLLNLVVQYISVTESGETRTIRLGISVDGGRPLLRVALSIQSLDSGQDTPKAVPGVGGRGSRSWWSTPEFGRWLQ